MAEPTTENNNDLNTARNRLVMSALHIFAEKGYEGASTREICERAEVNISAIRYYFGDKAGLYRAVFHGPDNGSPCKVNVEALANLPLPEALSSFYKDFLEPLKHGEEVRLVMKLHFREMIEPTGVWHDKIDEGIKPQHEAMVALLKQHLGLKRVDVDVHRLAFAMIGMAVHYYVGHEVVSTISPQLLNTPKAVEVLGERLSAYSLAMVEREAKRRAQGKDYEDK